MTRPYTLGKRAEKQEETRRRIVEAALELHGTLGPASTPISQVAERAGVQRHTLYAHFPDERSLLLACSGLFEEREPLPDPGAWAGLADARERLRAGLGALYAWYERNAGLLACVLRDAEHHPIVREMGELRIAPIMAAIHRTLGEGLDPQQQALLGLALSFHSWRTLTRDAGLSSDAAAEAMVRAVLCPAAP